MSEILRTYEKILDSQGEVSKLYEKLGRALRIEEVWPDAFLDGCRCSPILIGTNYPDGVRIPAEQRYPAPYHRVRDIKRTFLRRSDGVEHDITPEKLFWIFAEGTDTDRSVGDLPHNYVPRFLPVGESDVE